MPPCNCGKRSTTTERFIYTAPNGRQTEYRTEVEARAAQIRNKGGTYAVKR